MAILLLFPAVVTKVVWSEIPLQFLSPQPTGQAGPSGQQWVWFELLTPPPPPPHPILLSSPSLLSDHRWNHDSLSPILHDASLIPRPNHPPIHWTSNVMCYKYTPEYHSDGEKLKTDSPLNISSPPTISLITISSILHPPTHPFSLLFTMLSQCKQRQQMKCSPMSCVVILFLWHHTAFLLLLLCKNCELQRIVRAFLALQITFTAIHTGWHWFFEIFLIYSLHYNNSSLSYSRQRWAVA